LKAPRHHLLRNSVTYAAFGLAVFFCYQGLSHKDFILFDTNFYVADNPHVASGLSLPNIAWAFRSLEVANWHPLTWLSHMLDVSLFGLDPGGHHLHNALLHLLNAILVFQLLLQGTRQRAPAFVAALIFAIHPLNVENVAWIAQRKSLLATFFALLAILCYTGYARHGRKSYYLGALVLFCAGMMSKPMLVVLPCALLLWDLWPLDRYASVPGTSRFAWLRRLGALAFEKLPFFAVSGLCSWITVLAQAGTGAVASTLSLPIDVRLGNAVAAYAAYLKDFLWPGELTVFYPHSHAMPPLLLLALSALLLLAIGLAALGLIGRAPWLFVGWFWYAGWLVPVIGLVQVGEMTRADRYMYLPALGLSICLCFSFAALAKRTRANLEIALLAVVLLGVFAVKTRMLVGHWRDSETLFRYTLKHTGLNPIIENNLGIVLMMKGELAAAETQFRRVLHYRPRHLSAANNLGEVLARQGRYGESVEAFRNAVALDPSSAFSYVNLGKAQAAGGDRDAAMASFRRAMERDPKDPESYINASRALPSKRRSEALALLQAGLAHNPTSAALHRELGVVLTRAKDYGRAIGELRQALALDPALLQTRYFLARAYEKAGNHTAAREFYLEEARLNPKSADAWLRLARSFRKQGMEERAVRYYRRAVAADPSHTGARLAIARYYYGKGDAARVLKQLRAVLAIDPANLESNYLLGIIEAWQGRHAEAGAAFEKVLDVDPHYFAAWEGLGDARGQLGQSDGAIAAYREGLRLKPAQPVLMLKLAGLLADRDEPDARREAIALAEEAGRLDQGSHAALHLQRAEVFAKTGLNEQARTCLEQALTAAQGEADTKLAEEIRARLRELARPRL